MDVFLQQEQILTSCTKAIVKHLPTQSFFLNTYSIHNYIHIKSVLPKVLHNSPIQVTNVNTIWKLIIMKLKEKWAANQGVTSTDAMPTSPESQHPAFEHATKKPQAKAKGKVKAKSPLVASYRIAGPPDASPSGPSVTSSSITSSSVTSCSVTSSSVTGYFVVGRPPTPGPSVINHFIAIPSAASHFSIGLSPHLPLQSIPQSLPTPYMMPTYMYSLSISPPASGTPYHPSNHSFIWNTHHTLPLSIP